MKKTIFLSAGHSLSSPGACASTGERESDITIAIRNELKPLLKQQGFEVLCPPDDFDLQGSIFWVNQRCPELESGYALELHCNSGNASGAEIFYPAGGKKAKEYTDKIINKFCEITGLKNRGSKPDNQSQYKRLAWVQDTNCWAGLIEVGFLQTDLEKIKDYKLMAIGIAKGICEMYGIAYLEPSVIVNIEKEAIKEIKNVMKKYNL